MRTSTHDHSLARHQRLYRMLLLVYPRAFRQVYGADMVQVFGDRLRDERGRRDHRASIRVWTLTLLDLFKTAPLQRMEKKMTREAAFAVLFAVALGSVVATALIGTPTIMPFIVGIAVLLLAAAGMGLSGALKRDRSRVARGAGKLTGRDWWVVVAALAGLLQIGAVVGQAINAPSKENVFAMGIVSAFGLLLLGGAWYRTKSRTAGDWMIVIGILPFFGLWWMIWPSVIGLLVLTMALIDSSRSDHGQAASVDTPSDVTA